jgi:hypothetical protein
MLSWRDFISLANIISHIVQVFGFMRLGLTPKARNGIEATPRNGTGRLNCSQHPRQKWERALATQLTS